MHRKIKQTFMYVRAPMQDYIIGARSFYTKHQSDQFRGRGKVFLHESHQFLINFVEVTGTTLMDQWKVCRGDVNSAGFHSIGNLLDDE